MGTTENLSPLNATADMTTTSSVTEITANTGLPDADTICGNIRQTGVFKSADATCRHCLLDDVGIGSGFVVAVVVVVVVAVVFSVVDSVDVVGIVVLVVDGDVGY
ncbi:hypothetical protein EVAR_70893_1 [Eumeta japonica]|uniref:Uncharacterized protein n=1 Tax=Eumeta variegata TaxID=151549 RepID=A0A4C1SMT7_EUMVA|nr:hypothetical protein EVAR_70893_1 [Eumeta japonica]